jgi:hypothetical protein
MGIAHRNSIGRRRMKTNKERAREIVLKSKCMGYTGPAHDPVTSQTVDGWIEASIEAELDEAEERGKEKQRNIPDAWVGVPRAGLEGLQDQLQMALARVEGWLK